MLNEKNYPMKKYWLIKPMLSLALIGLICCLSFYYYAVTTNSGFSTNEIKFSLLYIIAINVLLLSKPLITIFTLTYQLQDDAITVQQGFFTRKQGNFFYHKIQDISLQQGFIDRLLNLYTVSVENAGLRNNARNWIYTTLLIGLSDNHMTIPGLSKQDAEALQQELLNRTHKSPKKTETTGL